MTHTRHQRSRAPARRHRKCRCPRGRSPLVDTAHLPLTRWGFTALALLALAAQMAWPLVVATGLAVWSWRHR